MLPIKIFCCYAREDQPMLVNLKKHLMPLQRQGLIALWSDIDLNAGDTWEEVLHLHLENADIILLLISPDFMASDYCYSTEMVHALERQRVGMVRVIPILLRVVFWEGAPFAHLQMLPEDGHFIATSPREDDAFSAITAKISIVVKELWTQKIQALLAEAHQLATQPDDGRPMIFGDIHPNIKSALGCYQEIVRLDPRNVDGHLGVAQVSYAIGKQIHVIGAVRLQINHSLLNAQSYYLKSLNALAQVEQIDSSLFNAEIYVQKSDILARLKRYEEALPLLNQALHLDEIGDLMPSLSSRWPGNIICYHRKVGILCELQRYQNALEVCKQANSLELHEAVSAARTSYLLFRLRRFEEALTLCKQAIQVIRDYQRERKIALYELQGRILLELQRPEEALVAYRRGLSLLHIGNYLFHGSSGDPWTSVYAASSRYFSSFSDLDFPRLPETGEIFAFFYGQIGKISLQLQRYEEALIAFQRVAGLPSAHPDFYVGQGEALLSLARYDKAITCFQTAIKLSKSNCNPQYYHNLGLAYENLAKIADAERAYAMEEEKKVTWQSEVGPGYM